MATYRLIDGPAQPTSRVDHLLKNLNDPNIDDLEIACRLEEALNLPGGPEYWRLEFYNYRMIDSYRRPLDDRKAMKPYGDLEIYDGRPAMKDQISGEHPSYYAARKRLGITDLSLTMKIYKAAELLHRMTRFNWVGREPWAECVWDALSAIGANASPLTLTSEDKSNPRAVTQSTETMYDDNSLKKTLSAQAVKFAAQMMDLAEQEDPSLATANDLARSDTKATDAFEDALKGQMAQHKPLLMDEDDWLEQKMEEKLAEIPKETRDWIEGMMDDPKVEDSEIRKLLDGTPGELYYEQCIQEEISLATDFLMDQDDDVYEAQDGDDEDSMPDWSEQDFFDGPRALDLTYKSGEGLLPDGTMYEYNYFSDSDLNY